MPAHSPKVSVIIPLFNAAPYIAACLDSVLAQTFDDFEIIVADDGSTDGSADIVAPYRQRYPGKIFIVTHPARANRGITASRNLAIRHARGEYLAFLDNDDLWLPEKLARQVKVLETYQQVALVYAKMEFINAEGQAMAVNGLRAFGDGAPNQPSQIFSRLLRKNPIPSLTVLARKHFIEEAGAFDETMQYNEDRFVWSKMLYNRPAYFIPETMALYRVHPTNFSRELAKAKAHAEAEFQYFFKLIDFLQHQKIKSWPRSAFAVALCLFFIRLWLWGTPRHQLLRYARELFKQSPFLKYRWPLFGLLVGLLGGPRLGAALKRLYGTNWAEHAAPTA